jgi:hypothetical protein
MKAKFGHGVMMIPLAVFTVEEVCLLSIDSKGVHMRMAGRLIEYS